MDFITAIKNQISQLKCALDLQQQFTDEIKLHLKAKDESLQAEDIIANTLQESLKLSLAKQ